MNKPRRFFLTRRQYELLLRMHQEGEEFVYERGVGYVGLERVGWKSLEGLLRACAISIDSGTDVGEFERYTINSTGKYLLGHGERPEGFERLYPGVTEEDLRNMRRIYEGMLTID